MTSHTLPFSLLVVSLLKQQMSIWSFGMFAKVVWKIKQHYLWSNAVQLFKSGKTTFLIGIFLLLFQVFKTILVVLLSIIGIQAQFSRSESEEFDSDGFWSENFRSLDNVNFDNFEFMPEFDFDSFFRKIDAPPLQEAQERRKKCFF